jgi:hypothetical protein
MRLVPRFRKRFFFTVNRDANALPEHRPSRKQEYLSRDMQCIIEHAEEARAGLNGFYSPILPYTSEANSKSKPSHSRRLFYAQDAGSKIATYRS